MLRVLQLKSHQEANYFETEGSSVDVVAKEDVIEGLDVALFARSLPNIEETHQIDVVAVQVAENFKWRL